MYKLYLVLLITLSAVSAAPLDESKDVIIQYENTNDGSGNYKFSFKTSGGTERQETGRWVDKGQPGEHLEVEGEYSYIAPDGTPYIVKYISDLNGYRILSAYKKEPIVPQLAVDQNVVASLLG